MFNKLCTKCGNWYTGDKCPICEQNEKQPVVEKPKKNQKEKPVKKNKPKKFKKIERKYTMDDLKTLDEKIQQLIDKYKNE